MQSPILFRKGRFLNSIKAKLLLSYGIFGIIVILMLIGVLWYLSVEHKIQQVEQLTIEVYLGITQADSYEKDFFLVETIDTAFYEGQKSKFIENHQQTLDSIAAKLKILKSILQDDVEGIIADVDASLLLINDYERIFKSLVKTVKERGFKDYGVEGQMREKIHKIENSPFEYDKAKLLMIRRHEKDYILRKQPHYIEKLKKAVDELKDELLEKIGENEETQEFLKLLDQYKNDFLSLVELEQKIGFRNQEGLEKDLSDVADQLQGRLDIIRNDVKNYAKNTETQLTRAITILSIVFLIAIIFLITFVVQKFGRPIQYLSTSIREVIKHRFESGYEIHRVATKDEVGRLSRDFNIMLSKVRERTAEVLEQKERISRAYEDIQILNDIGKDITTHLKVEDVLLSIYDSVNTMMDADIIAIGIADGTESILNFWGVKEDGSIQQGKDDLNDKKELSSICYQTQQEIFINHFDKEKEKLYNDIKPPIGDPIRQSLIFHPVTLKDKKIGIISVQSYEAESYNNYHVSVIKNISTYAAVALENAQVYQEIAEKTEEIFQQKEELAAQRDLLEERTTLLMDSMSYAQHIQSISLPSLSKIQAELPKSFIFFQPKESVSGDFYWFSKTEMQPIFDKKVDTTGIQKVLAGFENEKVVISAVDCTGHGIPGAFMSLLGNDLLHNIVDDRQINHPDLILNELHKGVRLTLNQKETKNQDGMDMAMVIIDKEAKTMEYAGAKNSLFYFQNNEFHEIKADKMPIGGEQREMERTFTRHIIDVSIPTTFYLFSDGFQDQFGGKNGKKYMVKKFKKLLYEIHLETPMKQHKILEETLSNWMGINEQIDDVLIIGVQLQF